VERREEAHLQRWLAVDALSHPEVRALWAGFLLVVIGFVLGVRVTGWLEERRRIAESRAFWRMVGEVNFQLLGIAGP
jgi:hypothetical protein